MASSSHRQTRNPTCVAASGLRFVAPPKRRTNCAKRFGVVGGWTHAPCSLRLAFTAPRKARASESRGGRRYTLNPRRLIVLARPFGREGMVEESSRVEGSRKERCEGSAAREEMHSPQRGRITSHRSTRRRK